MGTIAVTELQAIKRSRTEQIIIDSLMRLRDKEVDELVEEFVRNNEEYLEHGAADIHRDETLIKEIDEIYADYDMYKDKICYFKKQWDVINMQRMEEERKRMNDIFDGIKFKTNSQSIFK